MKKVFMLIIIIVTCSCSIVPTSWTTGAEEQKLVAENTIQSIEFYRRFETMSYYTRQLYLLENIKYNMLIEEIICGKVSDGIKLLMEKTKKEVEGNNTETKPVEPKPEVAKVVAPKDIEIKETSVKKEIKTEPIKQIDIKDETLKEPEDIVVPEAINSDPEK